MIRVVTMRLFSGTSELCNIKTVGQAYSSYRFATEYYCLTHDYTFTVDFSMFAPLLCDKVLGLKSGPVNNMRRVKHKRR